MKKYLKKMNPKILSVSRVSDIPAFYAGSFLKAIHDGGSKWTNPYNNQTSWIDYSDVEVIVFWSKHPKAMMRFLPELDELGYKYYFQYTLNELPE
ncbi:unnamed protein product, partial [marine sediment metagenome]